MQVFRKGRYLGKNQTQSEYAGVILSETRFDTGFSSDWHYHENPYITFILEGGSIELRKQSRMLCQPGVVIPYDFDEPHRNIDYQNNSRTFSIEFERNWLASKEISSLAATSIEIECNAEIKFLMIRLMMEHRLSDTLSSLSVETQAVQLLESLGNSKSLTGKPGWVSKIRDLINDHWNEVPTLQYLADELGIHPVTISKNFPRYFNCSLGDYLRRIKINRAIKFLKETNLTLWEIALSCGFSDTSHLNRVFKIYTGVLPSHFRNR